MYSFNWTHWVLANQSIIIWVIVTKSHNIYLRYAQNIIVFLKLVKEKKVYNWDFIIAFKKYYEVSNLC